MRYAHTPPFEPGYYWLKEEMEKRSWRCGPTQERPARRVRSTSFIAAAAAKPGRSEAWTRRCGRDRFPRRLLRLRQSVPYWRRRASKRIPDQRKRNKAALEAALFLFASLAGRANESGLTRRRGRRGRRDPTVADASQNLGRFCWTHSQCKGRCFQRWT